MERPHLTAAQSPATVGGLCGTAYTFAVDAYDAAGNRSGARRSPERRPCADTQAPTSPSSVHATSRTATSIALSWSASSDNVGVVGYGLYRAGRRRERSTTTSGSSPASRATRTTPSRSMRTTQLAIARPGHGYGVDHEVPGYDPAVRADRPRRLGRLADGRHFRWKLHRQRRRRRLRRLPQGAKVGTVRPRPPPHSGLTCGSSYTLGAALDAAANRRPRRARTTATRAAASAAAASAPAASAPAASAPAAADPAASAICGLGTARTDEPRPRSRSPIRIVSSSSIRRATTSCRCLRRRSRRAAASSSRAVAMSSSSAARSARMFSFQRRRWASSTAFYLLGNTGTRPPGGSVDPRCRPGPGIGHRTELEYGPGDRDGAGPEPRIETLHPVGTIHTDGDSVVAGPSVLRLVQRDHPLEWSQHPGAALRARFDVHGSVARTSV